MITMTLQSSILQKEELRALLLQEVSFLKSVFTKNQLFITKCLYGCSDLQVIQAFATFL